MSAVGTTRTCRDVRLESAFGGKAEVELRGRQVRFGPKADIELDRLLRPTLTQAGAAEAFQVVLPVRVLLDRYLVRDPSKRNIGLHAAKLLERGHGGLNLTGHAGGGGEDTMGVGVIAAHADGDARQSYRIIVSL